MGSEPAPLFKLLNIWYVMGRISGLMKICWLGIKDYVQMLLGFIVNTLTDAERGTCDCTRMPGMRTVVCIRTVVFIFFLFVFVLFFCY